MNRGVRSSYNERQLARSALGETKVNGAQGKVPGLAEEGGSGIVNTPWTPLRLRICRHTQGTLYVASGLERLNPFADVL